MRSASFKAMLIAWEGAWLAAAAVWLGFLKSKLSLTNSTLIIGSWNWIELDAGCACTVTTWGWVVVVDGATNGTSTISVSTSDWSNSGALTLSCSSWVVWLNTVVCSSMTGCDVETVTAAVGGDVWSTTVTVGGAGNSICTTGVVVVAFSTIGKVKRTGSGIQLSLVSKKPFHTQMLFWM